MKNRKANAMKAAPACIALALCGWAPQLHAAPSATVLATVNLRAGPSTAYPVVAVMGQGTAVQVFGCEDGYGWCDVQVGASRGWVAADYLQMPSPSGPVVVASSGMLLALPIIAFSFGTYWDSYYRAYPWYVQRSYYYPYWNRYPHGYPPPPRYPPPGWRPPPPVPGWRPPPPVPGWRPPPGGYPPPGSGRPPGGARPPATTLPAPRPSQPRPQPR